MQISSVADICVLYNSNNQSVASLKCEPNSSGLEDTSIFSELLRLYYVIHRMCQFVDLVICVII